MTNNQTIGSIKIRRSPYNHEAIRNFTNISSVISFIGGIMSFIYTIGTVVMSYYNEISFLKTMANSCYNFAE